MVHYSDKLSQTFNFKYATPPNRYGKGNQLGTLAGAPGLHQVTIPVCIFNIYPRLQCLNPLEMTTVFSRTQNNFPVARNTFHLLVYLFTVCVCVCVQPRVSSPGAALVWWGDRFFLWGPEARLKGQGAPETCPFHLPNTHHTHLLGMRAGD